VCVKHAGVHGRNTYLFVLVVSCLDCQYLGSGPSEWGRSSQNKANLSSQSFINVGISSLLPQSTLIRDNCYNLTGGSEYIWATLSLCVVCLHPKDTFRSFSFDYYEKVTNKTEVFTVCSTGDESEINLRVNRAAGNRVRT